jgi:hypothetical protein
MSELKLASTFLDRETAEAARSFLESQGIPAVVMTDNMGGMEPYLSYGYGTRLMVPATQLEEARELLKEETPEAPLATPQGPVSDQQLLRSAWFAAVLGVVFLPFVLTLYSAWLLFKIDVGSLTDEEKLKFRRTWFWNLAGVVVAAFYSWLIW